jgi:hypothetical protein
MQKNTKEIAMIFSTLITTWYAEFMNGEKC